MAQHTFPIHRALLARFLKLTLLVGIIVLPSFAFAVDTDGDGVDDSVDAFPNHKEASVDTDGDGKPDTIVTANIPMFEDFEAPLVGWTLSNGAQRALYGSAYVGLSKATSGYGYFTRSVTAGLMVYQSYNQVNVSIDGGAWASGSYCGPDRVCIDFPPGTHQIQIRVKACSGFCTTSYVDNIAFSSLAPDYDDDNDTVLDASDNCALINNTNQLDSDGDGQGNACDVTPFVANPGSLDASFNAGSGANSSVYASAVQGDGKMVIAGYFTAVNGTARSNIARLNADGSLDASFNPGGVPNGSIASSAVQADGKIVYTGFYTVSGTATHSTTRLNVDGSIDAGFDVSINNSALCSAIQADGKIIIAGDFTQVNGAARNRIARLNADGSLDSSFSSPEAPGSRCPLVLQPDGKVISRELRLNSDGSLDASFSLTTNGLDAIALQPDGKIIVGGSFTTVNGMAREKLVRLNTDGSLDLGFNPGLQRCCSVGTITLQPDGKIFIAGDITLANGLRVSLARLNVDGSLDTGFNVVTGSDIKTVTLQLDGKIFIGGNFTSVNGVASNRVARLHTGNSDGDSVEDGADAFPSNAGETIDTDHDGIGNNADPDDDNDGLADASDNCPLNVNNSQLNADGDAQGNACDTDDDNDGVIDTLDKFPLNVAASSDMDLDGFPDSWYAGCNPTCQANSGLVLDNCPLNANSDQLNTDGDTQGNVCDSDDDNDGLPDGMDPLPLQAKFNLNAPYKGSQVGDQNTVQ